MKPLCFDGKWYFRMLFVSGKVERRVRKRGNSANIQDDRVFTQSDMTYTEMPADTLNDILAIILVNVRNSRSDI